MKLLELFYKYADIPSPPPGSRPRTGDVSETFARNLVVARDLFAFGTILSFAFCAAVAHPPLLLKLLGFTPQYRPPLPGLWTAFSSGYSHSQPFGLIDTLAFFFYIVNAKPCKGV